MSKEKAPPESGGLPPRLSMLDRLLELLLFCSQLNIRSAVATRDFQHSRALAIDGVHGTSEPSAHQGEI